MEKPRGELLEGKQESKPKTTESKLVLSGEIPEVLNEISENLLALADLAEKLSQVPPEQLKVLFEERQAELADVLATFGITMDDLKRSLVLN